MGRGEDRVEGEGVEDGGDGLIKVVDIGGEEGGGIDFIERVRGSVVV